MSEPINWKAMTPEQRNRCVAEKVMGFPSECFGALNVTPCTPLSAPAYVVWTCDACFFVGSGDSEVDAPKEHVPVIHIPPYSTSMDTAWEVVRQMNKPINGKFDRYAAFIDHLEKIVGSNMFFDLFYCDENESHLTPERICIAALRACGYEVGYE